MANRCRGDHCPYGYGHHGEHVYAAKLGWIRRREGEAKYLHRAFRGNEVHSHKNGKVILRDLEDGATWELSNAEARIVIQEMRTEERHQIMQARLTDRETRARVKADEALNRKRQQEAAQHAREAERAKRDREREEREYQRQADRENRELFTNALREVVGRRGIRNYKKVEGRRTLQEDVWANIPRHYRAKANDTQAQSPDEVASTLSEMYPYLGIHTDSDLAQAFSSYRFHREARREQKRRQAA